MSKLQVICLSFLMFSGCAGLPDQPDGWSCTFFFDASNPANSSFLCNKIKNPSESKEFPINDPFMKSAHCMDLESFKAYSDYVFKLRNEVIQCRNGE